MHNQPLIHFFILLGGVQGVVLGLVHITRKTPYGWTRLLGWALATHALSDIFLWAFWTRDPVDLRLLILLPLNVVLVPVYFLFRYVLEFTETNGFRQRYVRWLSLAACLEVIIYLIPAGAALYRGHIDDSVLSFAKSIRNTLTISSLPVVVVTYFVLFWIIQRYQRAVHYEPTYQGQVTWLWQLFAGICLVYGLAILPMLIQLFTGVGSRAWYYPLGIASSLYLAWMGIRAFLIHERFRSIGATTDTPDVSTPDQTPSAQASLYEQTVHLIEQEQLYKQPSLKLTDVAARLSVSPHYLSRVVNQQAKKNFNDLVNEFRVAEVTRMMGDPAFGHYTLEGLGREAGFGAKSTYQASFKRLTGQTPSQYRANHRPVS